MIDMKVRKNFNLKNTKLDFSKELNEGIDVIALDISKGIERGAQFGKPFEKNAKSTIDRKHSSKPLIDEGYLKDVSKMVKKKAKSNHQVAVLTPGKKMRGKGDKKISNIDIAYYNDEGTSNTPARPFWGISEKAENEIMVRVKARLHRELVRA